MPWSGDCLFFHKVDDHPVIHPLQGFPNNDGMTDDCD